nr:DUF3365 domain-containing protein [Salinibacter altiplanensis]
MRICSVLSLLILCAAVFLVGCGSPDSDPAEARTPPDSIRQDVEQSIASLDEMRESLAATIDTPTVDKRTFKRVCKPVGQRAARLGADRGWAVQQLATKYRNPAHEPDEEARQLHKAFASSHELTDRWIRTTRNGHKGWRYARRITVQSSCLACHGPKEKRPDFVKNGYPDDRAYGFKQGDLRGIYSVFVPDTSALGAR